MLPAPVIPPAKRLQVAFDLFEYGLKMMRARFARESPGASPRDIEKQVNEWLASQPLPEGSDFVRRPIPRHWKQPSKRRRGSSTKKRAHTLARKAVDAISRAGKEPKRDLSADLERLLAERELPDDAFIKVPRSELAKRFGRKPAPRRKR